MSRELINKRIDRFLGISTPAFCMDDCLATLAHYLKVDYSNIYYNALEYEYIEVDLVENIGDKIKVCFDLYDNLPKILGLTIDVQYGNLQEHMDSLKKNLNSGLPVLIEVCGNKWSGDWRYNTEIEGSHAFWITEFSNGKCKISDPYYDTYESNVDIERLEKAFISIGILEKKEVDSVNLSQTIIEDILNDEINKINTMLEMKKDIKDDELFKKSLLSFDTNSSDNAEWKFDQNIFTNKIREIVYNHVRFANYIKDSEKQQIILDETLMAAQKWNRTLMYIMKLSNKKSIESEKINNLNNKIEECVDLDLKIIRAILDGNKKKDNVSISNKEDNENKCICLNLEQYFNNQAIGKNENGSGEFVEEGDYINEDSIDISKNVFWNGAEISLSKNQYSKDNIVPTGNAILINKSVNKIVFLCCACDEIIREKIDIVYEAGNIESKYAVFYDCVPEWNAKNNNDVVISCVKKIVRNGKEIDEEVAYLYGLEILANGERIEKILLPDNENIHIFAISIM